MILKISEVSPITGKVSERYIETNTVSFFELSEVRGYDVISICFTNGIFINAIDNVLLSNTLLGTDFRDCTVNVETAKGQES